MNDLEASLITKSADARPVVVHYCATFLKPEMLHIYRQLSGIEKFRTVVFAQKRENAAQFAVSEIEIIPKPRTHWLRRIFVKQLRTAPPQIYASEARRILRELERVQARAMHIYFGHIGVHLLPLMAISPIPIIVSFHGADAMVDLDKKAYRVAMQTMLQKVALVLVRSQSLADRLIALDCPAEKIRIHRTGIPLDQFPFRQRTPPADGAWKLVQACRLIPKKGLHTSLRAFAKFQERYPQASFTIAGEGALREDLIDFARTMDPPLNVNFTGFLQQEKLRELFAEAHFFLHPSEIGRDGNQEGVPNSMLEAMASGVPPLATFHGGIPEAVENGVSGILAKEGDHETLAAGLLSLAENRERYEAMSREAARAVREKFELSAQIATLESFYDEVIARAAH